MDTKNLTTLVAIIETGSFQKAAAQLNYAPSTVTSQIRQLEDELSLKLFEKVGRKMELTQAGRDILPFVRAILQNVEQINNYQKDLSEITGTLRLVAPDSIFIYLMQPIIKEILYEAPRINLVFNSLPSEEINQAIVNGTADIGIDCDKGHFPDTVVHLAPRPFQACLIASPFMAPAERDFITPHQRKEVSMILNEPYANYQKGIAAYLDQKDIVLNPDMKLQSIEAVKRSVMNNLGIAYVPQFSVEEELKNGSLLRLETELDDKSFPGVIVFHKNRWVSPQMELAFRILQEQLDVDYSSYANSRR
ncbi:MAG: LysR family transcriptional regulator [Clostridiales bacterium]|nr:LysR family transcriptional regulator [Clostridiales bacterium]